MNNDLTPTLGKEWRVKQQEGVVVRLPSGMVARVRGVQPDVIIRSGRLPDSLTPLIASVMDGKEASDWEPSSMQDLSMVLEFRQLVCENAMLEPRIVETPQAEDEIAYDDLEFRDKDFLMELFMVPLRQLELFRDEQTSDVDAVGAPKRQRKPRKRPATGAGVGDDDNRI